MIQMTVEQALESALAYHRAGRLAEAEAIYRRVLAAYPDHADTLYWLGVLACQTGHAAAAIELIGRAIALKPAMAEFHNDLGNALMQLRRGEEAIHAYRRAIALKPELADAHNNLGNVLKDQGRLEEAVDAYRRAIQLRPGYAAAQSNLGSALCEQGRLDEAIAACRQAIVLKPELAEAHVLLGNALKDQGELDEAIAAYRRAIALAPGLAEAHNNLGNLLKDQGQLDAAIAAYRTAVAIQPGFAGAASNLVFILHYHPEYDARSILQEHRRWAALYAEPLAAQVRPHANVPDPERRLRVGFLSPDLHDHPVGRSLVPLFAQRDRRHTEVVCYSERRVGDAVTEKLAALADRWHCTAGLSDQQVADLIRADAIDILVDPTLHTAGNRMLVFARKPAPVQVTLLGPPATTGLPTMDYRLTDRYLDPPGVTDEDYTEQSVRLPHCFWIYPAQEEAPAVGALPASSRGFVTLGCLNQFTKVSRPALQLWARILQALPDSRLVLLSHPGSHRDAARTLFREAGIAGDRVEFAARVGRSEYFRLYREIDLSLDPFPYNGHTSTMDSLWMGVPVITLEGRTAVGRGGVSILSNVGLPELIAGSPEEYLALAVAWAGDLARLSALRAGLRARLSASPLMDGKQYAADVEAAFRSMWKRWCGA